MKATLKQRIFLFFIVTAFLCAVELALRYTHLFGAGVLWAQPHPVLGWRLIPGREYWYFRENSHPVHGRINEHGWRDKERSLTKRGDIYRIAVLGDSFVEAMQIEQDRTFLALTEAKLNGLYKDRKFELLNFGCYGYSQAQEMLVLEDIAVEFSPDMVILFFYPYNDIMDISSNTASDKLRPFYLPSDSGELFLDIGFSGTWQYKCRSVIGWLKKNSAILTLIHQRALMLRRGFRKDIGPDKELKEGYLSLCTSSPDRDFSDNYALNKRLIRKAAGYCRRRGIGFMLVCVDIPAYIPEIEADLKGMDKTFNAGFFEDDLLRFSRSINIEYLGLQRVFRNAHEGTGDDLHWTHWNYRGHELVSGALMRKLPALVDQRAPSLN